MNCTWAVPRLLQVELVILSAAKDLPRRHTGMTNDLERRVYEHKHKLVKGFTSKYNITRLVWYEGFQDVGQAIESEKRIKGWLRAKKITLIESMNPQWRDLAEGWFSRGD